jgi:hypothetical protein
MSTAHRCLCLNANWMCVTRPTCRRRSLYELAELEEAQAEAPERWHQGAARQLRQLERALASGAEELRCGAAAGRGLVEFMGLPAGVVLTLYGLGVLVCVVGGAVGLAIVSGQAPLAADEAGCDIGGDVAPVDTRADGTDHTHTCVCQWPGYGDEDELGSSSASGSGSWMGNSTWGN